MHSFNSSSDYTDNSRDENRKARMAVPAVAAILLLLNKATELPATPKDTAASSTMEKRKKLLLLCSVTTSCDPALVLLNRLLKALWGLCDTARDAFTQ